MKTYLKKYGVSNPSCSDEARNKISEKVKESCTEERQKKIEESKLKKYGKRSITDSEKSMKSRIENNGSLVVNHKYEYDNFPYFVILFTKFFHCLFYFFTIHYF